MGDRINSRVLETYHGNSRRIETGLSWIPWELRGFEPHSCGTEYVGCVDPNGDAFDGRYRTPEDPMDAPGYVLQGAHDKTEYMRTDRRRVSM